MQLPGRLRGTTLGDVLGRLYRERATGLLELIEIAGPAAGRSHLIALEEGQVARVETEVGSARLGEILQERGYLPAGSGHRVAAAARDAGKSTGKHLLERQVVSSEQIASALREQVRRRLECLFSIVDAQVRFHVPRPRALDATVPRPLCADEFLRGRPRARGQSPDPVRADRLRVLGLDASASASDVKRAFRRLAAESHPDRFPHATQAERLAQLKRLAELSSAYHALVG